MGEKENGKTANLSYSGVDDVSGIRRRGSYDHWQ